MNKKHDPILYKLFKQENDATYINCAYAEMVIPALYIEKDFSEIIGLENETFGGLYIHMYESVDGTDLKPHRIAFPFPSKFRTRPSSLEFVRNEHGTKDLVLRYQKGDAFVISHILKKDANIAKKFIDILFKGYMFMDYDNVLAYWNECNRLNGVNLGVSSFILETILAELARSPTDLNKPYRLYTGKGEAHFINIASLPRYVSTSAAISSGDAKSGITNAINNVKNDRTNNKSPIEDSMKGIIPDV